MPESPPPTQAPPPATYGGRRRGSGRKKLPDALKRSHHINLHLTPVEWSALGRVAERLGLRRNRGLAARRLLEESIAPELPELPDNTPTNQHTNTPTNQTK